MQPQDFTAMVRDAGFTETVHRTLPPGGDGQPHTHEFDARLLILEGAFTVTVGGIATTHRPGDVFSVPAGTVHAEMVGPEGVTYIAARRYPTGLKS